MYENLGVPNIHNDRGKGKLQLGKSFNYGKARNIEYEDNDSPNIFFDVESSMGTYCPFWFGVST